MAFLKSPSLNHIVSVSYMLDLECQTSSLSIILHLHVLLKKLRLVNLSLKN